MGEHERDHLTSLVTEVWHFNLEGWLGVHQKDKKESLSQAEGSTHAKTRRSEYCGLFHSGHDESHPDWREVIEN